VLWPVVLATRRHFDDWLESDHHDILLREIDALNFCFVTVNQLFLFLSLQFS
jgi:hypothetical protein